MKASVFGHRARGRMKGTDAPQRLIDLPETSARFLRLTRRVKTAEDCRTEANSVSWALRRCTYQPTRFASVNAATSAKFATTGLRTTRDVSAVMDQS